MKILQVITFLHIGGAERLLVDIVLLFQKYGHQVDVLVFDGAESSFKMQLQDAGIEVFEFGVGGTVYNPLYIWKLIPFLKKYDIVHTHNTAPQFFAAMASVIYSVNLVTTEHSTCNRRRKLGYFRPIDRWMYNRYKAVICVSDQVEDNLRKYAGPLKTNILTIYNGINIDRFQCAHADNSLRTQGRFIVTMVAGFRYEKDQSTLIRAFKYLSSDKYELWLVGDGEKRLELEELVRDMGLEDVVRFWGLRSDIPILLKSSDIVVMSSHFEGLSLSSIEGMSVGKPFLASDVDGLHEMTQGAGVLFPHGDAKELSKVIECLTEDKDYYQAVAEKCMKRAMTYDISKVVEQYEILYQKLNNSNTRRNNVQN